MKTIAIMNYKGGVGKTVTTINFAAELAAAGKRVIVMDADGQCNLSDIFRADTLHGGTTYEVLTGETGCCWDELVQDTPVEGVKIVPASAELPKADIAALTGERLAKNGIRDFCLAVAEDEGADYILIDCQTAYNAATVAALGAADEIIIPVELEGFSLHGAGEIRSQVANMRTVNPRLRIAGALITKRRGTRIQEAAEQALRVSGIPAFEAAIPLRASVPASMSNLNASKTLRGYAAACAQYVFPLDVWQCPVPRGRKRQYQTAEKPLDWAHRPDGRQHHRDGGVDDCKKSKARPRRGCQPAGIQFVRMRE